ncbi:hypothetical protein HanIR_Chr04g0163661 [Helianthus annuus]|nr:hypothetical protein HanIR_Chr04g0163661 [Helianthus annuus]
MLKTRIERGSITTGVESIIKADYCVCNNLRWNQEKTRRLCCNNLRWNQEKTRRLCTRL